MGRLSPGWDHPLRNQSYICMYLIDDEDRVVKLRELPPHDASAPEPVVLATDMRVLLAYHSAGDTNDRVIIEFEGPRAHYFGPPNDEALTGHPLSTRGLTPYGSFEMIASSWIRLLEQRNRVHWRHDARQFSTLRHFVLTFHDKTFECIAKGISTICHGTIDAELRNIMLRDCTLSR